MVLTIINGSLLQSNSYPKQSGLVDVSAFLGVVVVFDLCDAHPEAVFERERNVFCEISTEMSQSLKTKIEGFECLGIRNGIACATYVLFAVEHVTGAQTNTRRHHKTLRIKHIHQIG